MYDLILGVSSLLLVYGVIAIIAVTIRAAIRAKRKDSGVHGHAASHHALRAEPGADPYYQAVCHHSRPLHLTR
jgi:hypothetical protein